MIKIPADAVVVQERSLNGGWWPIAWGQHNKYLLPSGNARAWSNHTVHCWLLTHPSGAYIVWRKDLNRPEKRYENEEVAKIAVELQL